MVSRYGHEPRERFTKRDRLGVWERAKGVCCICGLRIDGVREQWIVEHIIALENGGTNADDNLGPAHQHCAIEKTRVDHSVGAKLKRIRQRHLGIRESRNPMPFGRKSAKKRKLDGTIVPRRPE